VNFVKGNHFSLDRIIESSGSRNLLCIYIILIISIYL
jgi:hypothetical protein